MKLDLSIDARLRLGEAVPCPSCELPLKRSTHIFDPPVVTCFNAHCERHKARMHRYLKHEHSAPAGEPEPE